MFHIFALPHFHIFTFKNFYPWVILLGGAWYWLVPHIYAKFIKTVFFLLFSLHKKMLCVVFASHLSQETCWDDEEGGGRELDMLVCCYSEYLGQSHSSFYRTQVSLGSDLWVLMSVRQWLQDHFADLTDVTLADEDSNLIPTDDVNMAILGNMAMQVAPCGGQHWN